MGLQRIDLCLLSLAHYSNISLECGACALNIIGPTLALGAVIVALCVWIYYDVVGVNEGVAEVQHESLRQHHSGHLSRHIREELLNCRLREKLENASEVGEVG